jgi:hypothetical protein
MWVERQHSKRTTHKKSGQKTLTGWMQENTHTPAKLLAHNIVLI